MLTSNDCSLFVIDLRVIWSISFESYELVDLKNGTGSEIWITIHQDMREKLIFSLKFMGLNLS